MVVFQVYEVFETEEKGRGVRALQDIKRGVEILKEEPLACILTNSKYRGIRCDYCYSEPEKLLKCSKCKFIAYCGKVCQASDWKMHKYECKCLTKSAPKQPPDFCRLVSQLIFNFYYNKKNTLINNLYANKGNISNARKEAFFTFAAVLVEYLQDVNININDIDIYGLMCKASCNSFAITNAELNSLGTGIFSSASLFNHSCDPNCVATFNGRDISIRAIKPIAEGEELMLSYISILATSDVRQLELRESYMFTCKCTVCSRKEVNDSLMKSVKCSQPQCLCMKFLITAPESNKCSCQKNCEASNDYILKANDCMDKLQALYNSISVVPTIEQQKSLTQLIRCGEEILCSPNIALLQCYEVAMDGCIESGDWKGAFQYGIKLECSYKNYLSEYHPTLGLHYFKLGKLALQIEDLRNGITYLEKGYKVLSITHGSSCHFVQKLKSYLDEACQEMAELEKYRALEERYIQQH
ncbi:histone-lysine N-methyltransferase SMYD3 isoform X1 [Hydra vulgaris]|uniref:histone-lysine N-methyltransferase SMYD3 isoform X1 n=1 Tax=Hydra vulgaris TaxID=6087 RepID=UPI0006410DE0|nr:histone-lysine N-methyltransferase SMYD3 [Hydra vulgaris]